MPAVMVMAPARSKPGRPGLRLSATRRGTTTRPAAAMGTLMKNTQRQDAAWVITPPSSTPTAKPSPDSAPHMVSALVRCAPAGNRPVTRASAAGVASAAPRPCRARAPMSMPWEVASPSASDARPKMAVPARKILRRPARSAARPPSRIRPPNSKYVGVDHPGQRRLGEAQAGLDGRQGDVDHGLIEKDHELGHGQHGQGEPAAPGCRVGLRPLRGRWAGGVPRRMEGMASPWVLELFLCQEPAGPAVPAARGGCPVHRPACGQDTAGTPIPGQS